MAKSKRKSGPQYSDTLLKGEECLWLGNHTKVNDYLAIPMTHHFFQKRALNGNIGTIKQAGFHGAEVEFPIDSEKGSVRLTLSVDELLPMTTQQVNILRESISNTQGDSTVSTQVKAKTQTVSTTAKKSTYTCSEKGCSFSSPSPQGLGTHRLRSHNLQSRSQKRGTTTRRVVVSTKGSTVTSTKNTATPSQTNGATTNWKAKHDAMAKRYNRLSSKYETIIKTLKQLSQVTA